MIQLRGIGFRLNGLFLLVLLLFTLFGLLPQAIIVFSMVLIHEGAHLLTARLLKLRILEIELLPFGGVARLDEELALYPWKEILVAIMGPLVSLLLGSLFFYILPERGEYSLFLARTNLTLGLFNLTPALPLDGGRIFRSFLTMWLGLYRGTKRALYLAKVLALIMGGMSLWGVYTGKGSIFLLCISFFVYYKVGEEFRGIPTLMMKYILKKREDYGERPIAPLAILVVGNHLTLYEVLQNLYPHRLHLFYVVDRDLSLLGLLMEMEVIEYLLEGEDAQTRIGTLLRE